MLIIFSIGIHVFFVNLSAMSSDIVDKEYI